MVIKVKSIFSFFIICSWLMFSCSNGKTITFLKNCQEERFNKNEDCCLTKIDELKNQLPKNSVLHYIGSDTMFHYFEYFYDKTTKMRMRFKIAFNEFAPSSSFEYSTNNTWSKDGYPIYLSDM